MVITSYQLNKFIENLVEILFKVGPSFRCEKKSEKSKLFADVSKNMQIFLFFTLFYRFSFLIKTFLCYLERISQFKCKLHVLQHICEKFQAIYILVKNIKVDSLKFF